MSFRRPQFSAPVDLDAHLKLLPRNAMVRGMFINDLLEQARAAAPQVDLVSAAGFTARRFTTFLEYPYADTLRLMLHAAATIHPSRPSGEGLRRLGQRAYGTLLDSHAGRVVFGALGLDAEKVMLHGPKGYGLALSFGKVTATRVGDQHFQYVYDGIPAFLEHYHVGVIEGTLARYGLEPRVEVDMKDLAHATFDITWSAL